MDTFAFHNALAVGGYNQIADYLNADINKSKPWEMPREEKIAYLTAAAEAMRHIALMLLPFLPRTAQQISAQLNVPYAGSMLEKSFAISDELRKFGGAPTWRTVGEPQILFPELKE
jgi:methionyl-tRNA synthetase